jgi:hypothetical protein
MEDIIGPQEAEGLIQMCYGGSGEATRFICGYLAADAAHTAWWRFDKRLARRSSSHWRPRNCSLNGLALGCCWQSYPNSRLGKLCDAMLNQRGPT